MESIKIAFLKSKDIQLVIIGIVLGLIFWILESVAHIIFFRDTDLLHQLLNPPPHEIWMRLTVICMFIARAKEKTKAG